METICFSEFCNIFPTKDGQLEYGEDFQIINILPFCSRSEECIHIPTSLGFVKLCELVGGTLCKH
jgi:hypothetical protein